MRPTGTPADTRWIALLRAINVGGHNVTMERLRLLFAELGLANVATFIASGNVIFDAPAARTPSLAGEIERHLQQNLGYAVDTFLRTPAELAATATYDPFPELASEPGKHSLFVAFLAVAPGEAAQERLQGLRSPVDDFHIQGREVYWRRRDDGPPSLLSGGAIEKALKLRATARNITTVRKLAAKYPPAG